MPSVPLVTDVDMLATLLSSNTRHLNALAESWLALGASAFGVWQIDRPVRGWPDGQSLLQPSLVAPILLSGSIVGELRVAGMNAPHAQARLSVDANLISSLLDREYELRCMTVDLAASQDQQLALYRLTHAMRSQFTIEETLESLVNESIRIVKARAGFAIFVADGQKPILIQQPATALPEEVAWHAFWECKSASRELVLVEGIEDSNGDQIAQMFVIPIWARGTIVGGLGMANKFDGEFTAPDLKLARAIVDQASAQIEKVLLYHEMLDQAKLRTEMELARRVQLDLLPRVVPHVAGLDIYATSQPAYQVGGDFYDFVDCPPRPLFFAVGDVSGKGLSAALLMTMSRTALHSKAQFMPSPTPAAVMRQTNEDLYHDFTRVGVFATAFIGQYDPRNRVIQYANAGHSPVIYRPRDGMPRLLRADGTALGIFPTSQCQNQKIPMRHGDLLIVATDGFSDGTDATEQPFGLERLLELSEQYHTLPAVALADTLFDALAQYAGDRPQDDDQTLIVIKGVAE